LWIPKAAMRTALLPAKKWHGQSVARSHSKAHSTDHLNMGGSLTTSVAMIWGAGLATGL
jgi:hypothetical protein